MPNLPPLDCLRFFEAAARLESFARAAEELGVTAAAVAHRVRMLEKHLGDTLFERRRRSVHLNRRGGPISARSSASSPTSATPPSATAAGPAAACG